jgi:hypothetical protein
MSDTRMKRQAEEESVRQSEGRKKPYAKPSFRSEQVFETMALACGKKPGSHEAQCHGFRAQNS